MRKFKLILALVILGIVALFVTQNEPYFKATNSFRVKVPMMEEYHSPMVFNWQVCLGAFVVGGLIIFLASLPGRMRTRKTVKELNATIQTHQDKISTLKKEGGQFSAATPTSSAEAAAPDNEPSVTESAQVS